MGNTWRLCKIHVLRSFFLTGESAAGVFAYGKMNPNHRYFPEIITSDKTHLDAANAAKIAKPFALVRQKNFINILFYLSGTNHGHGRN
jgi:hypothetical protein